MVNWINFDGLSDYLKTIKIMEDKVEEIINGNTNHTIYLIEYTDVYTAGSSYNNTDKLSSPNINIIHTNRGGRLTYHGPGQRIIYPIIDLGLPNFNKDIKKYVKNLEKWIILTLNFFGINSYIIENKIGVWTKINNHEKKIASIGIRIKKWIAYHGIAININTDLSKFNEIIPCGLKNVSLTSLSELGINITMEEFDNVLKTQFNKVFK